MQPHDTILDIPYGYCHCGCGQKTKIARQTSIRDNTVAGEPVRYLPYHHQKVIWPSFEERFWAKVDKRGPDDCWNWTGAKDKGYGKIGSGDREVSSLAAHRVSWEIHNGPVPDGLLVCHNCPGGDNPSCVNPAHLFLGTQKDNMQDCANKGRARGKVHIGTDNPKAKLTVSDVLHVRDLAAGGMTATRIASIYGMHQSSIQDVIDHKTWKHVP